MGANLVRILYFRCCEATRFGVHLASIPCHDGTSLRIALKFAMECICRQCADLPKVCIKGQRGTEQGRKVFQFNLGIIHS